MHALCKQVVGQLLVAGADHAVCYGTEDDKHELNAEWDEVSLLRSTSDRRLQLVALVDGKRASLVCNELGEAALKRAVDEVVAQARASRPDEANAIAEASPPATFESGPLQADLDAMADRLNEFLDWRKRTHPSTNLRGVHLDFTRTHTALVNSNGVDLQSSVGSYRVVAVFSAKRGADVSSFNYSGWHGRSLERPIAQLGSFDRLLGQASEQLKTGRVPEKFVGDVIITPDCLGSFLGPLTDALRDQPLISGTSMFKDDLGEPIADERLTVRSCPMTAAVPQHFTLDGYVTADSTVIEQGVLKGTLLSLYGANKTGRERAPNSGGRWVVDPGEVALDEMIGSVKRGVLLCRFSGGRPSDNGDFSGIAKNSYYIEDGRLRAPISETMVSGNLRKMIRAIAGVSRERVDFGIARVPWVQVQGLTIS